MPRAALLALLAGLLVATGGAGERPRLRVGTSGDYAPFSVRLERDAEGFEVEGLDVDVARAFAESRGYAVEWVPFRWPELLADLAADRFDVAMSGVTVRPERSLAGRFTAPIVESGAVLLVGGARTDAVRALGADASLEERLAVVDRPGVRVAVNQGGHLERVARARLGDAALRAVPDNARVRALLAAGEVDAVVTDTLEAPHWREGLDVELVGPLTRDRKAYLLPASHGELAQELSAWLRESEAQGELAGLRRRWVGAAGPPSAAPMPAVLASIDERLSLMPAVAEAKRGRAEIEDLGRERAVLRAAREAVEAAAPAGGAPAPDPAAVDRLYRALIEAAKDVQRDVLAGPPREDAQGRDLRSELRPALLRIGARLAEEVVVLGSRPAPDDLEARVAAGLVRWKLSDARRLEIAGALRSLSGGAAPLR